MSLPNPLILEDRPSIKEVVALHASLVAALDEGNPLHVDGSRVQEIDTATLVVLACAWRAWTSRQLECSWLGVSEPLRRAAEISGTQHLLELPQRPS